MKLGWVEWRGCGDRLQVMIISNEDRQIQPWGTYRTCPSHQPSPKLPSYEIGQASSVLRLDQVTAEGDVGVHIITVDGVLPLTLEEPHPHVVAGLQWQHDTLALHDAALTGLCVQDHSRLLIVDDMHIGLLVIPAVHVEAEEVEATQGGHEAASGHVKVAVGVHEDPVEQQWEEVFTAVQACLATHREGRVVHLA